MQNIGVIGLEDMKSTNLIVFPLDLDVNRINKYDEIIDRILGR